MIPAQAGDTTLSIDLADIRSIKHVEGTSSLIVGLDRSRFVVVAAPDLVRALVPGAGNGPTRQKAARPAPRSPKASTRAEKAAPRVASGPYGPFYKACREAGYAYCPTCRAYRQPEHEACDPGYLFRPMIVGNFSGPPIECSVYPEDKADDLGRDIPEPYSVEVEA